MNIRRRSMCTARATVAGVLGVIGAVAQVLSSAMTATTTTAHPRTGCVCSCHSILAQLVGIGSVAGAAARVA